MARTNLSTGGGSVLESSPTHDRPLDLSDVTFQIGSMHDMLTDLMLPTNPTGGDKGDIVARLRKDPLHLFEGREEGELRNFLAEEFARAGVKPGQCGVVVSAFTPEPLTQQADQHITFATQAFTVDNAGKVHAIGGTEGHSGMSGEFRGASQQPYSEVVGNMTFSGARHAAKLVVSSDAGICQQVKEMAP